MGRTPSDSRSEAKTGATPWPFLLVAAAVVVGLGLLLDEIRHSSATYDEVAYLRVAAKWWRTGAQREITRMGSPLSFWKFQQAPVLWAIDLLGRGELIDDPIRHQEQLLPLVRSGALWIWFLALGLCAWWSKRLYGPSAMVLAAWLFTLSPNLLAHGGLVTMELPVVACTSGMGFLFWTFLTTGQGRWFWASAVLGGLAFSCKFTSALIPLILAIVWWVELRRDHRELSLLRLTWKVALGIIAYVAVMLAADFVITGLALLPLSTAQGEHPSIFATFGPRFTAFMSQIYETPIPQDWVGFATQTHHQMTGGSSYLLGERSATGWRSYYFVALAVKVPLAFWLLLAGRIALGRTREEKERARDDILPLTIGIFLTVATIGSSRNYGVRYLLPLAPLAIIWVSRLAERTTMTGSFPTWQRAVVVICLAGQAFAVAKIHPHELTYFNALAGGPMGGRHILSDSNLDWGQGLKGLARLQRAEPEFRDLTLYYFGDTEPRCYGVSGSSYVVNAVDDQSELPGMSLVKTRYLAVSASLQWGPWGPPGFFRELNEISPVRLSDDTTIAIYRTVDLPRVNTDPVPARGDPPDHRQARQPSAPRSED
jgi:hypothetical protein